MKYIFPALVLVLMSSCPVFADSIDVLITELKSPSPQVREDAIDKISNLGPNAGPAIQALITAYEDKNPANCNKFECVGVDMKPQILAALTKIGAPAAPALPLLLNILTTYDGHSYDGYTKSALIAIASIGKDAVDEKVVKTLATFLKNLDEHNAHDLVGETLKTLARLEEKSLPALPVIKSYINSGFPELRAEAFKALIKVDPDKDEIVEMLMTELNRADDCCSTYIENIAIPYLKQQPLSPKSLQYVDMAFRTALNKRPDGMITKPAIVSLYIGILIKNTSAVSENTIQAMAVSVAKLPGYAASNMIEIINLSAALGPEAKAMVPVLDKKISDSSFTCDGCRAAAFNAIDSIAPGEKPQIMAKCQRYIEESYCH